MKKKSIERLQKLSDAFGPSGFEDDVASIIKAELKDDFEVEEDKFRNLYVKKSSGKKLLVQLDAHTDEVGFMVHSIDDNGLIKFIPLGSWVETTVPGELLEVKTYEGELVQGVVGSIPPHFMSEEQKKKPLTIDLMRLDVGLSSKEEVQALGIEPGLPIVPVTRFYDNENVLYGKAFDCRIGCAAQVDVLQEIKDIDLNVDVIGTFSTQEEVGGRGIEMITTKVAPDLAIIFEGTPADDTFAKGSEMQTALRSGPMLRHIDVRMITHPRFQRFALETAKELGIPVQAAVRTGGGTNGHFVHKEHGGVPTIVVGIPVRYAHTPRGFSSKTDYDHAVKLVVELLKKMDEKVYEAL
ncbi:M42 family metallopeptidase [Guggenheimella bovis]